MSAARRPHHLWVWFDDRGAWQSVGHGTADEMNTALAMTQRARATAARTELTLDVAVNEPAAPTSGFGDDVDAAALIADRARAPAVHALTPPDPEDYPAVAAFAAATYAVAAELHAFRLAMVAELQGLRLAVGR